jgi:hypothetical protein
VSERSALPTIQAAFAKQFANWEICLPEGSILSRERGEIREAGWSIQYLFGANERGEYLDYYSSHRMTDDSHRRIYESGEVEKLEVLRSGFSYRAEVPGDKEREEAEFRSENQRITALLDAKGFGPKTINSALRAGIAR